MTDYRLEDGWIETQYAGKFDLNNPVYDIRDMAHSLARLCRYNGHCLGFYSVAEHSVLVSVLMEDFGLGDPVEGLLHDGTESVLSDVPAPFKQFLPDWQKLDARLDEALRRQFSLPLRKTKGCKEADWLALFLEAYHLMPSKGAVFSDPYGLRAKAMLVRDHYPIHGLSPSPAELLFRRRYQSLTGNPVG